MAESDDLTMIMSRASDVFVMFCALQEQGFDREEALHLVNTMIMAGALRRRPEPS
jgi:hypothetical protein